MFLNFLGNKFYPILLLSIAYILALVQTDSTNYPVIFIPGDGGNQIHARLNKTSGPHYFCVKSTKDYFLLWLNLEELSPYVIQCLIDNLKLTYNNQTRKSSNTDGVDIKIMGFGSTETIAFLDSSNIFISSYFAPIVNTLETKLAYKKNVNIRGAPYDWRRAPNEHDDYFQAFTKLVVDTYEMNNQSKCVLVAHSMGNPMMLYWLNNYVDQSFKDKYIKSLVSIAPVWGGAVKTLRLMASGDNIDVFVVRPLTVRPYQRSAISTAFLMPSPAFWSEYDVLVSRPSKNYTVSNYDEFFQDIGFPDGYQMRLDTQNLIYDLKAPNVELHVLYGTGLKTPEQFVFTTEAQWPDSQPAVVYGDGDGTVNLRSLLGYQRWFTQQKQAIYFKEFTGAEHLAILKNPNISDYILNLVQEKL